MQEHPSTDNIWRDLVIQATGCSDPVITETVQSLWSGFGSIYRVTAGSRQFIVKDVSPPGESAHPRGWSSDYATARKLRSYDVEINWYRHHSKMCNEHCRVPAFQGAFISPSKKVLLLEDLDTCGFPIRVQSPGLTQTTLCVDWLAHFHASFLGCGTDGLWPVGTYWHLATRPDEFEAMENGRLKSEAQRIDRKLNACQYQTLVHGDAKLANFCFAHENHVAAVDFQYTGAGCGMKDLAYLVGSCFSEEDCEAYAGSLLDRYFNTLAFALKDDSLSAMIEQEWRSMYPLAWTDFYRFLAGWMPTHKKIHRYTKRMAEETFDLLSGSNDQ